METNERGPLPSLCNWQKHSSWPTPGDHHLGYKDPSAFPVPEVYRTDNPTVRTDEERTADSDLYGYYHYSSLKVNASSLWLHIPIVYIA